MSVTIKDVEHIAELARLEFDEKEKEKLTHELNDILKYIGKLNELDTSNVEPLSHVIELSNVFRDDVQQPSLPREKALANAPKRNAESFLVPAVLE